MISETEYVVLVDSAGVPMGRAPKVSVHHAHTPLHLAFSVFLFNEDGRALFQQRAWHKPTWPGVWSNACCGHPAPDETLVAAAHRRLAFELGITAPIPLELMLPDFRYRARWGDLWENEICPVFTGTYTGPIQPNPAEVADVAWISWADFALSCVEPGSTSFAHFSPWSRWEAAQLLDHWPAQPSLAALAS